MARPGKEDASEDAKKIVDDAKNFIEKAISDIGKTSATKQLILGTASGCQKGYIDINWDKINKKVDKITDKIEKEATGQSPDWFEKVERFVDRKLDKAEDLLKKKEVKAKKWVHNLKGDDHYRATESHVFLASFAAGMAIGLLCGK
ncbi:unnamed protein product [Chrysodeixis includens]|uniref:Uncharacterized protein n=1 Tax=Chrysodeixis includens TaxID=689277 RepID=A0A9N8PWN8_CHRIL|nr:unnamed protein product [Chrysodeixis includens]